mmetsp:Transcript_31331/g.58828  ORF Transcript_31331/g.58828 Transcript_31331/m.58828 type:complete len:288 (+) Transcript_31331:332-1195(+)
MCRALLQHAHKEQERKHHQDHELACGAQALGVSQRGHASVRAAKAWVRPHVASEVPADQHTAAPKLSWAVHGHFHVLRRQGNVMHRVKHWLWGSIVQSLDLQFAAGRVAKQDHQALLRNQCLPAKGQARHRSRRKRRSREGRLHGRRHGRNSRFNQNQLGGPRLGRRRKQKARPQPGKRCNGGRVGCLQLSQLSPLSQLSLRRFRRQWRCRRCLGVVPSHFLAAHLQPHRNNLVPTARCCGAEGIGFKVHDAARAPGFLCAKKAQERTRRRPARSIPERPQKSAAPC